MEINYSDPPEGRLKDPEVRRLAQLAKLLRTRTLVDVDSWSNVYGQPLRPGQIYAELKRRVAQLEGVAR